MLEQGIFCIGVASIMLNFRTIEMFSIQTLLHFSKIVPRVCTLVLFIIIIIIIIVITTIIVFHFHSLYISKIIIVVFRWLYAHAKCKYENINNNIYVHVVTF